MIRGGMTSVSHTPLVFPTLWKMNSMSDMVVIAKNLYRIRMDRENDTA